MCSVMGHVYPSIEILTATLHVDSMITCVLGSTIFVALRLTSPPPERFLLRLLVHVQGGLQQSIVVPFVVPLCSISI